jgi:hypothetical protein
MAPTYYYLAYLSLVFIPPACCLASSSPSMASHCPASPRYPAPPALCPAGSACCRASSAR